jgi:uncharacterized membrane protein
MNVTLPASLILSAADLAAIGVFFASTLLMRWLIEHAPESRPSTSQLMAAYRRAWMAEVPKRENRIVDATLVASLRNGAAFFASGTMIAIGGIFAALGQAETIMAVASDLTGGIENRAEVWEMKLIFILFLVVNAFLAFVWSHRLFGYCAVLIGAIPEAGEVEETRVAVERAASLNITAARSFNRGLRGTYYAIAALALFFGPVALGVAALVTSAIIYRREFLSESRRALMAGRPGKSRL